MALAAGAWLFDHEHGRRNPAAWRIVACRITVIHPAVRDLFEEPRAPSRVRGSLCVSCRTRRDAASIAIGPDRHRESAVSGSAMAGGRAAAARNRRWRQAGREFCRNWSGHFSTCWHPAATRSARRRSRLSMFSLTRTCRRTPRSANSARSGFGACPHARCRSRSLRSNRRCCGQKRASSTGSSR